MRIKFIFFALIILLVPLVVSANEKKQIYGVYEPILLPEISRKIINAKLDTGASTTSLGAYDIEIFTQDKVEMVSFIPQIPGAVKMELPLVRYSKIKSRNEEDAKQDPDPINRPVVKLTICMGGQKIFVEVNLTDRSNFKYPLLLGTKALKKFNAIVDPSLKNTSLPKCQ